MRMNAALALALLAPLADASLVISEYVEGSGLNKAIELFNTGSSAESLAGHELRMYFNGQTTAGTTVPLTGSIAPGATFVVAVSGADAALLAKADLVSGGSFFNGDDAVVLSDGTNVLDSIGQIGVDPGSYWGTSALKTQNMGLRRVSPVVADTDAMNAYDTAGVWEAAPINDFSDIGQFSNGPVFVGISEYVEGSGLNKAIELFNGASSALDLTGHKLQFYFNGQTTAGTTVPLTGSIAPGATFVVAVSGADAALLAKADLVNGGSFFNGDDAVVFRDGSDSIIDSIGQIGVDPGSYWGTSALKTQNMGLRRVSPAVADTDASDAYDTAGVWEAAPINDFSNIGQFSNGPVAAPAFVGISEYVEGSGLNKAIELFNGASSALDLTGHKLQFYFNGGSSAATTITLTGSIAPGATFVVAVSGADAALLAKADLVNGGSFFNGDDAVVFRDGSDSIIDSIGQIGVDPGSYWGTSALKTQNMGLRRVSPAVADTDASDAYDTAGVWEAAPINDFSDIGQYGSAPTPTPPATPTPAAPCGSAATKIHAVQGSGASSPLVGSVVEVEAVVVGVFAGLGGVALQEEAADQDADAATSEGVFVVTTASVSVGDVVRVRGTVAEAFTRTQLTSVTSVSVCSSGTSVAATTVPFPAASATALEAFEGMLVTFAQELFVTEVYNLGRFGELALSSGSRLFQPTQLHRPGTTGATTLAAQNALNRILLDDASTVQNPDPVVYPTGGLSAANPVRVGDKVSTLVGVLDYGFGSFRVQPTQAPVFVDANARPASPSLPGTGNLRIASFNVLNFFNGDGLGGGFPTPRGADTPSELVRQRVKIVNTILGMSADIIGLLELENDGFGANSAIQELVNSLNAAAPYGCTYAFVNPDLAQVGTDAIAVGLIYNSATVSEAGTAVTTSTYPFDARNRQPLAQAFRHRATNDVIVACVNHFKSKGSCPADGSANDDSGDGQGCWNEKRTEAAQAVADWLDTNPTDACVQDRVIMGDLNGYAREDPLVALENMGYTNVLTDLHGPSEYSYVFNGQSGSLDHVLVSASLQAKVTGASTWHINGDEPRSLDYNEEFKSAAQQVSFYDAGVFRSSDHDPSIIDIKVRKYGPWGWYLGQLLHKENLPAKHKAKWYKFIQWVKSKKGKHSNKKPWHWKH